MTYFWHYYYYDYYLLLLEITYFWHRLHPAPAQSKCGQRNSPGLQLYTHKLPINRPWRILIIVHNTGSKSRRRPNLSDSLFSYTGNRDAIALFQSVRKNIRSPSDHQRRAYQPFSDDNPFLVKIHFLGSILSVHKLFDSGISTGGGEVCFKSFLDKRVFPYDNS